MRNTLIAFVTIIAVSYALPAAAEVRSSRHEHIGLGSGAVVGAVAGGPVGFIIGAAVGAKIGESFNRKIERIEGLEGSLDAARASTVLLESDIERLNARVSQLRDAARPELVDLMQAGIDLDLLFRTDESVLLDATGSRLAELATTLAAMPEIRIRLDGYADERGNEDYNQKLSEKRVQHIRDHFLAAGVDPTRIDVSAHGESIAADTSPDSYALERRVSVKLFLADAPSMAANPD